MPLHCILRQFQTIQWRITGRNCLKLAQHRLCGENYDAGADLKAIQILCISVALAWASVHAQEPARVPPKSQEGTVPLVLDGASEETSVAPTNGSQTGALQDQDPPRTAKTTDGKASDAPAPEVKPTTPSADDQDYGKQEKRILGIIPNYRAVSANTYLPPLSFKSELWLATQDTFDYSDFIFVAALSGIDMAGNSEPTFGQGAEGYGKYYWHVFADTGIENYMAEAIVPAITREDPRYYTLGKGGLVKRTGYALSRLFVTRTNSGGSTFNLSEVVGAGGAAGIGNLYYPAQANPWVKTYQRWGTQVGLDGVFNVVKEFWPDINKAVFRGKY
jgi:hypothetical protein